MPRIQIQFHAAPDEALGLATQWARDHDLTVVAEQFFPDYQAVAVPGGEVSGMGGKLTRVDRVALCRRDPDLAATAAHEFVSRNPGCLFLSIGPRDDDGLRESALGGATDDDDTLRAWRRIVKQAKAGMHQGAAVRNPHSGVAQRVPKHLHTPGAHELAEQGVTMLAAAGWNRYEFDDGADV
jgi:hypothetical protein